LTITSKRKTSVPEKPNASNEPKQEEKQCCSVFLLGKIISKTKNNKYIFIIICKQFVYLNNKLKKFHHKSDIKEGFNIYKIKL
jgi:hypothetical protein